MIKIIALLIFIIIFLCPIQTISKTKNYYHFDETTKRFTINTKMLNLSIEGGAIVYIKDNVSNEILLSTNLSDNFPPSKQFPAGDPRGFVGFTSRMVNQNEYYRRPSNSAVVYSQISQSKARLVYGPLYCGGNPDGGELIFDLTVAEATGEILMQLTGVETRAGLVPVTIDLPLMNFTGTSTIAGSTKYARNDIVATGYSSQPLASPSMVVAEGSNSCLAAWSESDRNLTHEYVKVLHNPKYDQMVLHTPQDPTQSDVNKIVSSSWRIGTYKNWLEAARRWRKRFEQRTMAKPLWENRAAWVRKIHAVHGPFARHYDKGSNYAQLANIVPPENLLYFMWNGDRIVLFGDHTLIAGIAAPQPGELQLIKKYGWRLLLYHPWTLYHSQTGADARLQKLREKGWLQPNYQFNPDYEGTAADWYNYWADVDANYSGSGRLKDIHPGSTKFKNYLVRNYRGWCATYQADGSYFDILGSDEIAKFAADRKIIEGQDYATGEKNAIVRLNAELPNLPVMSENIPTRLIPYVFYTWEGYYQYSHGVGKVNHPLRTALIGSYVWSQEQDPRDSADFNNEASALLGALPTLSLVGDYKVSKRKALWSQARAKLFCQEELFNDLPPQWDPEALAYYSSKGGHWFKFKKFGENKYAYVEEIPGRNDLIRLTNLLEHLN